MVKSLWVYWWIAHSHRPKWLISLKEWHWISTRKSCISTIPANRGRIHCPCYFLTKTVQNGRPTSQWQATHIVNLLLIRKKYAASIPGEEIAGPAPGSPSNQSPHVSKTSQCVRVEANTCNSTHLPPCGNDLPWFTIGWSNPESWGNGDCLMEYKSWTNEQLLYRVVFMQNSLATE